MPYDIPTNWKRSGLVLARDERGGISSVAGDTCIVWDDELPGWRMVLFYDPPGHAHAVCMGRDDVGPGRWRLVGPLAFTNPGDLAGNATHKPFVIMDAHRPNVAARIDGRYWLVTVSYRGSQKVVQRAHAERLAGPWTVERGILIDTGTGSDFDAKHVDAVTGFWFPERDEILYFYMGYPATPQDRAISRFGSAQAVAVQKCGEATIRKLGVVLSPCQQTGHWASGWVGGLQLLPGAKHQWIAVVNASPTAPDPENTTVSREEPPPSLGGFAFCDEDWPVKGWKWCPEPIERIENIPAEALANGEGVNLWRQHILGLPDGKMALFYNSGSYGKEQLYVKMSGDR
jgi:hypothetical protein